MSPLLALLALQSATLDPAKDPALAKPITIHLALSPLRTVVAAMAKASGQPLDVAGALGDWKATVLVKELPAGRTMEALADTLGLVWKQEGGEMLLGRPEGAASAESAYLAAERSAQAAKPTQVAVEDGAPAVSAGAAGAAIARRGGPRRGPGGGTRGPGSAGYSRFDPNLLAVEVGDGAPPTRLSPAKPSGDSAFAKAALAWPSVPTDVDEAWRRPIPMAQLGKSTWESGAYSTADVLVAFHDISGLPIVADAFRVPSKIRTMLPGTGIGVLQSIAATDSDSLRLANGVARLRHPAFWRLREQEVSEATWGSLERSGPVNVESLASFASRLTTPQVAAFRSLEAPLSHVPTAAIRDGYPALGLWSALPSGAKSALLAGRPVGLAAVRGASDAYAYALREAPYYHAGDPTRMLSMNPAQVGIFGSSNGKTLELRLAGEQGGGVSYVLPL